MRAQLENFLVKELFGKGAVAHSKFKFFWVPLFVVLSVFYDPAYAEYGAKVRNLVGLLDRPLSTEEAKTLASVESYFLEAKAWAQALPPRPIERPLVTTFMFCLGIKGGLILKGDVLACLEEDGKVRLITIGGTGLAVGFAGVGLMLIHRGPEDGIAGYYTAFEANGPFPWDLALDWFRLLRVTGGSMVIGQNAVNGSLVLLLGMSVGPMIDLSWQGLVIY